MTMYAITIPGGIPTIGGVARSRYWHRPKAGNARAA